MGGGGGWCRSERSEEPKAAVVMPHSSVGRHAPKEYGVRGLRPKGCSPAAALGMV